MPQQKKKTVEKTEAVRAEDLFSQPSLADLLKNNGLPFEYDGESFLVRIPTTHEIDYAQLLQESVNEAIFHTPEIQGLKGLPVSKSSEGEIGASIFWKNRAEEKAALYAVQQRDRWLAPRLICDTDGNQLWNPLDPKSMKEWDRKPIQFKEDVRSVIWRLLLLMRTLPFDWDR